MRLQEKYRLLQENGHSKEMRAFLFQKTIAEDFCKKNGIKQYKFDDELRVHTKERVKITGVYSELPIKFGLCESDFSVEGLGLKTLKGCPKVVMGNFDCYGNNLINLEHGPITVLGSYFAKYNKLIDLKGCAITIGRHLNVEGNHLTSFNGLGEVRMNLVLSDYVDVADLLTVVAEVKGDVVRIREPIRGSTKVLTTSVDKGMILRAALRRLKTLLPKKNV